MSLSFRGTRFLLTVHSQPPPAEINQAISDLLPKSASARTKILHEVGKTGHKHAHAVVLISRRVKLTSDRKWAKFRARLGDFNVKPVNSDEHFQNCLGYDQSTKKQKTPLTSTVVHNDLEGWAPEVPYHLRCIEFIQNVACWKDVLVDPEFSQYISGKMNWAREVYMHARMRKNFEFPSGRAYDWQQTFIDYLTPCCEDNRTVHWVVDYRGGNGKSDLTNYLLSHNNAFLVDCGKLADIAYAYDNQPIVVFDLARDTEDYCPYRAMEAFKNGRFFSPKYNSCLKTFKPPHVVVFANYAPKQEALSQDRWNIVRLDELQLSGPLKRATGCPYNIKAPPGKMGISQPLDVALPAPAQGDGEKNAQTKEGQGRQMAPTETSCGNSAENRQTSGETPDCEAGGTQVFGDDPRRSARKLYE